MILNRHVSFKRFTDNWPVKILSIAAAIVLYLFYRIGSVEERFFGVPLSVVVDETFVAVGELPTSVRIRLRGPSDDIFLIFEDDIEAYVDLTVHKSEGRFRVPVFIRRSGAADFSNVETSVEPLELAVTQEKKLTRSLDVYPTVSGSPADGFELVEYSLNPSTVEMVGPRSAIEDLSDLTTEAVDLSGRDGDFSVRVRLERPDALLDVVGSDIVEFNGTIREIIVARFYDAVPVELRNVPGELKVDISQRDIDVNIRGAQSRLRALLHADIELSIDMSPVTEPGVYTLAIKAKPIKGIRDITFIPETLNVVASISNDGEI